MVSEMKRLWGLKVGTAAIIVVTLGMLSKNTQGQRLEVDNLICSLHKGDLVVTAKALFPLRNFSSK